MEPNPSSSKADRKTIERNRRNRMKTLYSKLTSLIPPQSREASSLPDQLEEATNYIKKMQIKLEKLKERRDFTNGTRLSSDTDTASAGLRLPHIDIQERGSALEVVLITKSDCQFMFTETIRLLHEEGAEVVNASFSVLDETIFHTVHSKIGESAPCSAAARISEKLKKYVYGDN
ncbi:transcription factor bHLH162 [Coffea eugenioides]|uniref:Transcription factor bHLH162 n=1 Tax=Coffea arabica TaxID=13443 RepID=A0A6P6W951_COFAR|nr:transcription factor bHLH162-like [Coffea arabica]XP_027162827.1 transcription factor bHLH162 [Coffea eugenioides]